MIRRSRGIFMRASILFVCLACAIPADAADTLYVSLDAAVEMALEHNSGVRLARLGTQIQAAAVSAEEVRFGRSLGASVFHQSDRSPSISLLEEVETSSSNSQSVAVELSQRLWTGGSVGLGFSNNRSSSNAAFRTIDPVYRSDLELRFSHPLLRGRGKVNRAGLEVARTGLARAKVDQEGLLRDLRADVSVAYWNLFLASEHLEVKRQLSEGARRVLEMVRARVEMGVAAENTILQAEVGLARREEEIVIAEEGVRTAEDRLKSLLDMDRDRTWEIPLVPAETPDLVDFEESLEAGIARALDLSTAYRGAQLALRSLDLQIDVARDRTRPSVALTASAGVSGIGAKYRDDLEVLGNAEGRSWQGGLSLDIPLGAHSEHEEYLRLGLERTRAEVELEDLRRQIVQQVRGIFRQVHANYRRVEIAMLAERLAERNVGEEENRLALGLSTVRDVLDAQDDLAAARVSRLQALVDYTNSRVEWGRATGERL